MSELNNVQLPHRVLASLYKDTVIVLHERIEEKESAKWFLGNNTKGVLIVVKDTINVYLDEEKLQLLGNILFACKMNIDDVAIVNYIQTPNTYKQMKGKTQFNYVFLFDVSPNEIQLPLNIIHYQTQSHDNCTILCAPDMGIMTGNTTEAKQAKTKLWGCLKKIFNL